MKNEAVFGKSERGFRRLTSLAAGIVLILAATVAPLRAETVTVEYRYDQAGRLVSATYGGTRKITYRYDKAGNLLGATVTTVQAGLDADGAATTATADTGAPSAEDALALAVPDSATTR